MTLCDRNGFFLRSGIFVWVFFHWLYIPSKVSPIVVPFVSVIFKTRKGSFLLCNTIGFFSTLIVDEKWDHVLQCFLVQSKQIFLFVLHTMRQKEKLRKILFYIPWDKQRNQEFVCFMRQKKRNREIFFFYIP